ncbi:MAG: excinuclease ABC subunit UvrA [Candidatus Firestonebacteria bacterium]
MQNKIIIKGAREHNLKNIDLEIPRNKLVVITGLSGSGKSSLAFDTIYAEGQRRYVESLSAYARQFLGQMEKPDVDYIEGLSPAIAIEQKQHSRNPRSTVGTITEIYDYLRLLFARIGIPHCYKCGKKIVRQTSQQIIEQILSLKEDSKIQILAPLIQGRKGEYKKTFDEIKKEGYVRVRVNGEIKDIADEIKLDKNRKHTIEVVVDRLTVKKDIRKRLANSVESALKLGKGIISVIVIEDGKNTKPKEILFSEHFACIQCGISFSELAPRMFSFNNPYGACSVCTGLGHKMEIDTDLVIPNKNLSLNEGALVPWYATAASPYYHSLLEDVAAHYSFSMDTVFSKLPKKYQDIVLYGPDSSYEGRYEGIVPNLMRRFTETESEYIRDDIISQYMKFKECSACNGARLKPESLAVKVGNKSISEITKMSIKGCIEFFNAMKWTEKEKIISHQILKEVKSRLQFLMNVGLDYLTLERSAGTLSGGEAERIHLATQIGSSLVGVLYILDEPSIGLHQRDNQKLINTLKQLQELGNTVIVVEHDEETMLTADYIVDLGPGAGADGGKVVIAGTPKEIIKCPYSITGQYLSGKKKIPVPTKRRIGNGKFIEIFGVTTNNLKNINVRIPLGTFTCVTGVSGSGKSSLIGETLYPALIHKVYYSYHMPTGFKNIIGTEEIDKVINIDQSPIGRTPRSNPVTYTGVFTYIRELFSITQEAKIRGYKPGRFSFNVKGGRCEACQGEGVIKIEMHFLPDVYVQCDVCKGKRYNSESLEVKYKGKNISEVLDMIVTEAVEFFTNIPKIKKILQTLYDVGLGYVKLGQPANTLSGGEAQRVKLSTELAKRSTGRTFYILDEPTTGLHFADIQKLLDVLNRLVNAGNTVLVIEHNLDVIKTADYIIDLGPEGGEKGGYILASAPPEELVKIKSSSTGHFLKKVLS